MNDAGISIDSREAPRGTSPSSSSRRMRSLRIVWDSARFASLVIAMSGLP
jgi:hypothetical protein